MIDYTKSHYHFIFSFIKNCITLPIKVIDYREVDYDLKRTLPVSLVVRIMDS